MTTETILTNQEISDIWSTTIEEWGLTLQQFEQTLQFARAIEQAVLQSPEIQALRKDAGRVQFVADEGCMFNTWIQADGTTKYRLEWGAGSSVSEWQDSWFDSPRASIDAAMEKR